LITSCGRVRAGTLRAAISLEDPLAKPGGQLVPWALLLLGPGPWLSSSAAVGLVTLVGPCWRPWTKSLIAPLCSGRYRLAGSNELVTVAEPILIARYWRSALALLLALARTFRAAGRSAVVLGVLNSSPSFGREFRAAAGHQRLKALLGQPGPSGPGLREHRATTLRQTPSFQQWRSGLGVVQGAPAAAAASPGVRLSAAGAIFSRAVLAAGVAGSLRGFEQVDQGQEDDSSVVARGHRDCAVCAVPVERRPLPTLRCSLSAAASALPSRPATGWLQGIAACRAGRGGWSSRSQAGAQASCRGGARSLQWCCAHVPTVCRDGVVSCSGRPFRDRNLSIALIRPRQPNGQ